MMSKQHVVPRLLQRGFRLNPEVARVWWITRDLCVERNIEKLWNLRSAYSNSMTVDADKAISDAEQQVKETVHALRGGKSPCSRRMREDIGRLVAHLEARQLRLMEEVRDRLMWSSEVVFSKMQTPEAVMAWAQGYTPPNRSPEEIGEAVMRRAFDVGTASPNTHERIRRRAVEEARTLLEMQEGIRTGRISQADLASVWRDAPTEKHWALKVQEARRAMAAVYAREPIPKNRAAQYAWWRWSVVEGEGFVLGDTMVFNKLEGEGNFASHLMNSAGHEGLYLPIAHDKVLVGRTARGKPFLPPEAIRQGAVCTTREGFIANRPPREMEALRRVIGRNRFELDREDCWRLGEFLCDEMRIEYEGQAEEEDGGMGTENEA